MYVHFEYNNGSNPYIAFRENALFFQIVNYNLTITGITPHGVPMIEATPRRDYVAMRETLSYNDCKEALRDFAIEWQHAYSDYSASYSELAEWGAFFEEYGRKYGLLRELRENGIL